VENWTLLTNHAQVLLAIAGDPGIRLRDIAATLGITERSAHAIVTDLAGAGYVAKHKDGRRNRYQIQAHLPLPGPASQQPTIGELLDLLTSQRETTENTADRRPPARPVPGALLKTEGS
jgi:DNA-binding IclR family transcriptional regulator